MLKFNFLLRAMGLLLWIASRTNPRIKSQLSRDIALTLSSQDGVSRVFQIAKRKVNSASHSAQEPTVTLTFETGDLGFRVLLASDAIDQLVDGFRSREIVCEGEAAVALWFYELVMGLIPWRRPAREAWPDSYTAPNPALKGTERIIREGITNHLDPSWLEAHKQREKTLLWRVARGATPDGKFIKHQIVIDAEDLPDSSQP